jgi:glyoxylase-like metal-dependent hydrolase (beta-lactamase superfamily II)
VTESLDGDGAVWAFDLGTVTAYLIDDGDVTLVDTGTPGAVDDLRAGVDEAGYAVDDIDRVLITHFDIDHVGGLAALDLDVPVHAMDPDAGYLDGSRNPPILDRKGLFQRLSGVLLTRPDGPIRRIEDGDEIGRFRAYHTPGHTPGHVAFHHSDLGVAVLGDLVSEDAGRLETPSWFLMDSTAENAESIRALAGHDLDFSIACVGHGDPLPEGGSAALSDLAARL